VLECRRTKVFEELSRSRPARMSAM
jgi:hypothetical protein